MLLGKNRMKAWRALAQPRPPWPTFKQMLTLYQDPNVVLKKWRKNNSPN